MIEDSVFDRDQRMVNILQKEYPGRLDTKV